MNIYLCRPSFLSFAPANCFFPSDLDPENDELSSGELTFVDDDVVSILQTV
jgi:hypothetical protein